MRYSFGDILKKLRKDKGWSQEGLANTLNEKYGTTYNKGMISKWENNKEEPRMDTVRIMADFFDISLDELLGLTSKKNTSFNPELTEKDEKTIQMELQKLINGLEGKAGFAAFDGGTMDDMDEEDRELLLSSLENSLRIAKRISKQKFTPKKYRD